MQISNHEWQTVQQSGNKGEEEVENPWINAFHGEYEILEHMRVCAIIFKIREMWQKCFH